MTETMIQRCDEAVSQLWEVYYLTTTRSDADIVLDAIIKIKELPCLAEVVQAWESPESVELPFHSHLLGRRAKQ